jgi:hypothetical protein
MTISQLYDYMVVPKQVLKTSTMELLGGNTAYIQLGIVIWWGLRFGEREHEHVNKIKFFWEYIVDTWH